MVHARVMYSTVRAPTNYYDSGDEDEEHCYSTKISRA